MVEVHPKSEIVRQAQFAAFIAETVSDPRDSDEVFSRLSQLTSETSTGDISRITTLPEDHLGPNGKVIRIAPGTKRLIATPDEYLQYLRSVGGSRTESIQGRVDILTAYSHFATQVNTLKAELSDPEKRTKQGSFIGSGLNAAVFRVYIDGKEYAVRVPHGRETNPLAIDGHIAGAILGKGVPHLEQIVAASYEDGVTVAEIMPGKEMGNLAISDVQQISDDQLSQLVDTVTTAHQRGIKIDPKPSNLFYDATVGFGIVDYHSSFLPDSALGRIGDAIGVTAADGIFNAGIYGKQLLRTTEDYSQRLALVAANLGVLKRLRYVVENRLQGEDLGIALGHIDSRIQMSEEMILEYSSPSWVEEKIRLIEEDERRREMQRTNGRTTGLEITL